ncbi:MAG TPA: class I SAM-dependent methyltransferase [Rubrivivax sp.]|nr:class I SAM-dependent methyltransferase [Rubrivivax sp.]
MCHPSSDASPLVDDELELLAELLPLQRGLQIVELGCGNARLARALLRRFPACRVSALEVDARQHAKNLAEPQPGLSFVAAPAQAIPFADAGFDLALMLKSLHHVPLPAMDAALAEARRVLRARGVLYVSEPVYDGPLNEIVRLFNDEGTVRAAAQAALDRALAGGGWDAVLERRFHTAVQFRDFADFERRMVDVSFAERHLDDALRAQVRARFEPHLGPDGARFVRPMQLRLLRRRD